jgi:pre-rRNA-processing protein TSR3
MSTIIYRHRKESRKKCTLTAIEGQKEFLFLSYPTQKVEQNDALLLALHGPELSNKDHNRKLLILDSTWRKLPKMEKALPPLETRTLPSGFRTAYPRRQLDCEDPTRGLASIEAIYIAFTIMGKKCSHLLDNYHFKTQFLELNKELLQFYKKDEQ